MYATVLYMDNKIHKDLKNVELEVTKKKQLKALEGLTSQLPLMIWFQARKFIEHTNILT